MSGSGLEIFPNVREWSGCPPGCLGVVGIPFRMSRSGRENLPDVKEALSDIREQSGGPPRCPVLVDWPSQMYETG